MMRTHLADCPHRVQHEDPVLLAGAPSARRSFCPPARKCPIPEPGEQSAASDLVQRAVQQSLLLGGVPLRMFGFLRDANGPAPEWAAAVAAKVLAPVVWADGVDLLLENGTRSNAPTLGLARRFLDALVLDAPGLEVGLLWDPGNSVFSGFDAEPFPGDLAGAAGLVKHVHVKDPEGTRRYVRLGDGDLPWPAILATLSGQGYDGWLTLETHWRLDRELTGRERDEPWGEGISAGGREASAECMRIMSGWLT